MTNSNRLWPILLVLALLVAACGNDAARAITPEEDPAWQTLQEATFAYQTEGDLVGLARQFLFSQPLIPGVEILFLGLFAVGLAWHAFGITRQYASLEDRGVKESAKERYEKGRLACLKQNYELAQIYFETLHREKPGDEDVIYQLGKTYIELGRIPDAMKLYESALNRPLKKWKREMEDLYEEYRNQ